MTDTVAVLRAPHVPRLLTSGLVGRIPSAVAGLAASLVMRDAGLGFDVVGWAVGAFALGLAAGGPVLGRAVDRRGQTGILIASSLVAAVAFVGVDLARDHAALVILAMLVAGAATPPLEPCLRALWPDVVDDDRQDAALSLDAAAQELVFIVGPVLVAATTALFGARSAVWLAAGLGILGSVAFARSHPSRTWSPASRARRRGGALADPGLVLLLGCLGCVGAAIGSLTLFAVSYAETAQPPGGAGVLLAVNAMGALIGALVHGSRRWIAPTRIRLMVCAVGLSASYLALAVAAAAAPNPVVVLPAMAVAGLFLAPMLAVSFAMVTRLAPPQHVTEAFAWLVTLFTIGNAVGSPVAGLLADRGVGLAGIACGATLLALGVAVIAQGRWRDETAESEPSGRLATHESR